MNFQPFVSFAAFMNFYIQAKNPIQTSQFFEVEEFQEFPGTKYQKLNHFVASIVVYLLYLI